MQLPGFSALTAAASSDGGLQGTEDKTKATSPRLTSVFVSLSSTRCAGLDVDGWADELAKMKDIGVDSIITKYSAVNRLRDDLNATYKAFYPSKLPWLTPEPVDAVGSLLEAADASNMSVHLGHWEDAAWFNKSKHDGAFLDGLAEKAIAVCSELVELYGQHASFVGARPAR